jgi:tetratricopeptide (TPR) repeat protein
MAQTKTKQGLGIHSRRMRTAWAVGCILLASLGGAQSIEQWTRWGDAAMARGEHYGATRFYDGALAIDGGRLSLQWKQAEACRLSHQYDRAAALYDRVHKKDQGRTYREALRWLGEMQLSMGDPDAAERTWNRVLQKEKDKGSVVARRAENALIGCGLARALRPDSAIRLEHLPQPINSYDSEFGARIGPDSLLWFASLRGKLNKQGEVEDTAAYRAALLHAPLTAMGQAPADAGPAINGIGDNANAAWSLDGRWLLFTRCAPLCRIHVAPVDAQGRIGEARVLPGIGEELTSTQPMIAWWDEREMLLFASDRPGGAGGYDLWMAEFHDGAVRNLSPLDRFVNTPGNERSPWYDGPSRTLWYSSDFHPGLGGYDIFRSTWGADVFSAPIHAGLPINSPANDLYPALYPSRGEFWLTSNRKGSFASKGETCCNDLYRFKLPVKRERPAAIADAQPADRPTPSTAAEQLLAFARAFPVKLYFHNDDPEPRSWSPATAQTYDDCYRRYKALIAEYEHESADAAGVRRFFAEEVDRGWQALGELEAILWPVLSEGRSITLEVRGHASPLAKTDYNRILSRRRIESLRNHLRAVDGGRFLPYLNATAANGARLEVKELPFGEERSAAGVSDDLRDTRASVHSVSAMRERRIEVVGIGLESREQTALGTRIVRNVGTLRQDEERRVPYTLVNTGTSPMRLLKSEADCGCTTAELPQAPIPPGGSAMVEVTFNGRAREGQLRRIVYVETDGDPFRFELVLEGEVVP